MTTATRRVFIVTCPLELPLLPHSQNPHLTVDSVPRIADSLGMFGLTKHWEVCVEAAPGSSDSVTKLFGKARYFGGPGPSWWKGADDGLSWDADRVAHIEAVELVGETRRSDAEIIEIGGRLRNEWGEYLVAWWNCQDYSIRLAHIAMAGGGGGLARGPILGDLMGLLATCRSKLIITRAGLFGVVAAACFMMAPVASPAIHTALSAGVMIPQKKRAEVARDEERLRALFPELCTLQISPSKLGNWMDEKGLEIWWRNPVLTVLSSCMQTRFLVWL